MQNDLNKPKPIQKVRLPLTVKVLVGHAGWLSQAKLIATQEVKETAETRYMQQAKPLGNHWLRAISLC